ncbi:MAG: hypothetical protein LBP96_00745 [Bacteroidales bacterium]|jgi:outer membrane biosynthesis protein TonB|nr:hypothetical protein [Bacteroidales bacterium]
MNERQRNTISAALTVIILGLLWILLLLFSMKRPWPPPPEYGVEIMGEGAEGAGRAHSNFSQQTAAQPSQQPSNNENIATADNDNVPIPRQTRTQERNPKPVETPTSPQQETKPQPEEPQINQAALFQRRQNTQSSSEGTGNTDGSGSGSGVGSGTGTGSGSGTGAGNFGDGTWELSGRQAKSLPKPIYNSEEQGVVVVRITVNQSGVVVKAEPGAQGTTTTNASLWQWAKEAALKSRFNENTNAANQQVGTITYRFIKVN